VQKVLLRRGAAILFGRAAILFAAAASPATSWEGPGEVAVFSFPKGLKQDIERIAIGTPSLAPIVHGAFCVKYQSDCEIARMAFRLRPVELNEQRWKQLFGVNSSVNRTIFSEPNPGAAGETWLVSPGTGDCNDYAVTKRHELSALGWPSRALFLAEVVFVMIGCAAIAPIVSMICG
jgi:predicted transglutaminase-like cysteine proteinase